MLYKVEVITEQGATLELPLTDQFNGYLVKDVQGLDPVKATMVSSSFALMDGEQYQSSRRESRNILLKLGLEANYTTNTVRQLKARLYSFLMPKSLVLLRFFIEDEPTVEIYGRVESFEAPSFTQSPEETISLICHQPDFYIPDPVVIEGFTSADIGNEFLIEYSGTVETGIQFVMNVTNWTGDFDIIHRPSDGKTRTLEYDQPLLLGDVLEINTSAGSKRVYRTREGVSESLLYAISPYSNWITLMPGPNYLRVNSERVGVPFTITYTTKLGGI